LLFRGISPTAGTASFIIGAWLGDDRAAIDAREIDVASHTGNFAKVAAAAHKLKRAAQVVGGRRSA